MKSSKISEPEKLLSKFTNRMIKTEKELEEVKKKNELLQKNMEASKSIKSDYDLMLEFLQSNTEWLKANPTKLQGFDKIKSLLNANTCITIGGGEKPETKKADYKPLKDHIANINLGSLAQKIGELNDLLESAKGDKVIRNEGNMAFISQINRIKFALYKNGVLIEGYDFFEYSARQTAEIVVDIMEGYFPNIFEKRYPNGVYLTLVDELDTLYVDSNDSGKAKLIQKVPKQVVKNGELIDVRDEIKKVLAPMEKKAEDEKVDFMNFTKTIGGNLLNTIKESLNPVEFGGKDGEECHLKIKTPTNKFIYLNCQSTNTLFQLYEKITKIINQKFNLYYSYPFTKIDYEENKTKTLKELDMVPNCLLVIKSI